MTEPDKLIGWLKNKTKSLSANDHTQLGYKYQEQGKLDKAIKEYLEALRLDPNFALARSNLGYVYNQQGKIADAIREWAETLRRGVESVTIRGNTEDWLREAQSLRDERNKQIDNWDSAIKSYLGELGQMSDRWSIAYDALERIGSQAEDALIEVLESDNDLLSKRAMALLGKIGGQRAIAPLEKAAKISENEFRHNLKVTGYVIKVDIGGTQIEVPFINLWKEYRRDAKEALKNIKRRIRKSWF